MNKLNLKSLMLILVFGFGFALTGCENDPCEDVVCQNGGLATEVGDDDCECDCAAGYEGEECATVSADKFVGMFEGSDDCTGASYPVEITKSGTDETIIRIENLGEFTCPNDYNVEASVDGNTLTIAEQTFCTNIYTLSGSGSIEGNTLTIEYTVSYDDGGTIVTETCEVIMLRQ
ncbi:MAG: hypothetical protein WD077_11850 [Bacteroidia bacterium]